MQQKISPAQSISGTIRLPGDKSISHRYAMLASIARGVSRLRNYSTGADCRSTLGAVRSLGIQVENGSGEVVIHGRGLEGLNAPAGMIDAGNSGSTIRMLSGILAGQPFESNIEGDESLARRPMARIIKPLTEMGASINARDGQYPPLKIRGRPLRPIDYELPVASAQVKSCVLFAGLYAEGLTTVHEPLPTRDHTEIALREFGADVSVTRRAVSVAGRPMLTARDLTIPGDLSSAAFFIVAALLAPGSELTIQGVGLNPTRTALLDFLVSMGADIQIVDVTQSAGELTGDLRVRYSKITGGVIEGATTAAVIDEIPVLAVLGAHSAEGLTVRNAGELRVKETDRIATVAENLRRMGATVEVAEDGLRVSGGQRLRGATVESFGDHRIAMAFCIAALAAEGETIIDGAEAASVSFPEFYSTLHSITGQ